MSDTLFTTLEDLDRAAKKLEDEQAFRARITYQKPLPEGQKVVFGGRGHGRVPATPEELKARILAHKTGPLWKIASPDLDAFAEWLVAKIPDDDRAYVFIVDLARGEWTFVFGPWLCYRRSGTSLPELVRAIRSEFDALPKDWKPPTSAEAEGLAELG